MQLEWSDLLTVFTLIILEGILSGDNALVLAVLVQRLPEREQKRALRYGILGAFVLRAIATFLAVYLIKAGAIVALLGGLYLLYLPYKHFTQHPDESPADGDNPDNPAPARRGILGLSLFWSTVISVELTDLVFAVDSILVAVGMTKKTPVIIAGGVLGILMMRMLTMQVLELVKKYPKLIDGAYIIVAWVGAKLMIEFLHEVHLVPKWFHISKEVSVAVVIVLFVSSLIYARKFPNLDPELVESVEDAQEILPPDLVGGEGPPGPAGR